MRYHSDLALALSCLLSSLSTHISLFVRHNSQVKMQESLSGPVEAPLDGANNETSPAIRKLLQRETKSAISAKKHFTQTIQDLNDKVEKQNEISKDIKRNVEGVSDDLFKVEHNFMDLQKMIHCLVLTFFVGTKLMFQISDARKRKQLFTFVAGMFGRPEEVAGLVEFLALYPAASYITGQAGAYY